MLRVKQPDANLAMIKWLNSHSGRKTDITPTWKNLFLILHLIDLEELAKQIEAYWRGTAVTQLTSSTEELQEGKRVIQVCLKHVLKECMYMCILVC